MEKIYKFVNKKYDPIIILSGTPQGAFFSEEKNLNIINIINEDKNILNLQLAFGNITDCNSWKIWLMQFIFTAWMSNIYGRS